MFTASLPTLNIQLASDRELMVSSGLSRSQRCGATSAICRTQNVARAASRGLSLKASVAFWLHPVTTKGIR